MWPDDYPYWEEDIYKTSKAITTMKKVVAGTESESDWWDGTPDSEYDAKKATDEWEKYYSNEGTLHYVKDDDDFTISSKSADPKPERFEFDGF